MENFSIRSRCKIHTNVETEHFVGIMCENQDFSIHFPLGFHVSSEEKELRKDIFLLINTISSTVGRRDSEIKEKAQEYNQTEFPFQAYIAVIYDYYSRGYYKERDVQHMVSKRGKIDWNRTIKTQKPYIQDDSVFYLDFVTKRNSIKDNELITLVHEYCVYEAFRKVGWLFTATMPAKPKLKYNEKLFRKVLKDKLGNTFNDKNKELFIHMLAILNYLGEKETKADFRYGTYRFEYVWESLIDRTFGIADKEKYYPKTMWDINDFKLEVGEKYDNSSLRPDTIMVHNRNVYVLDAKYYKYGVYRNPNMLPKSTDINKQITYGEYIAEQEKFKKTHGENYVVYNAFLMPFDSKSKQWEGSQDILRIGCATGNWKKCSKTYEKVQGVLIDLKHLMKMNVRENSDEILRLAQCIEQYV